MKLLILFRADLKLLIKYGFLALYAIFTALYLLILAACPPQMRETVRIFLIFTDPAAIGLFFMGALLLLEKSQRVLPALAVSPAAPWQLVCSKALALASVGTLVGAILSLSGPAELLLTRILTLLCGAFFFSLAGMAAAFFSGSLNQFILLATGAELLLCLPGLLELFGLLPDWLAWHPGALVAAGLQGRFAAVPLLLPWAALALVLTGRIAGHKLTELGGMKL